ncbi:MAG: hypothetical protein CL840_13450 [Crocinitomicaceae bacterium]|nr:hypothetical protein [Crocinitomicaceae bacterium]
MINLKEIALKMSGNDIILTYQGLLEAQTISDLLDFTEHRMVEHKISKPLRKKVFMIMLESLQNSHKHGHTTSEYTRRATVALVKTDVGFELILGNFLSHENRMTLESKLKMIEGLSEAELKSKYMEKLMDGEQSDVGGSGLGLMDIARKSGNKMEYIFDDVDGQECYFTLNIKIS